MSKPILVTGADGFIGSHVVEHLLASGRKVRALSCYNSFGDSGWLKQVKAKGEDLQIVNGDVRDPHFAYELVEGTEEILHLAALIAIPYSYVSPQSYVETNVNGTLNLLQAARRFQAKKFIHTSTSEVYGSAQRVPISEDHPLEAQSPYAATKTAADQLAISFQRSFELPVTVIRPFNTYGPRQSMRAVIPTVIIQAIDGGEIRLGSLEPTRDFSFVTDTAAGIASALAAKSIEGQTINLGAGFEVSIGQLVEMVGDIVGRKLHVQTDSQRVRPAGSEVDRLLSDNRKAKKLLGWSPEFGGLDGFRKGLEKTVEWFRQPGNRALYGAASHYHR